MKRKLATVAAIASAAAIGLGAGGAGAHTTSIPSEIVLFKGSSHDGFNASAAGFVASKVDPRCLRFREVELRQGTQVIDEGTTSRRGGFYLLGPVPSKGFVKVKMARKDLVDGSTHNHVCSADTVVVPFAP